MNKALKEVYAIYKTKFEFKFIIIIIIVCLFQLHDKILWLNIFYL